MCKKMMMIAGFCLITMLTGCGMLESYDLPNDHKVIKNVELSDLDQVGVEYNGRVYVQYGTCKHLKNDNIKECVGYVMHDDYPDDKNEHIYTIAGDDAEDFLIQYYVSGVMEQPVVLRAIDTVGKDVNEYDFVEYYDLWTEGFWDTGIDMGAGKVISENDSHEGFHGDGLYFSEIKFSDDSTLERIKTNTKWHKLPLSKNLNEFIYEPLDDGIKMPKITNGYYYFYDRHSESSNPYDDTELLSRGSYNFTVMIYDCDSDTLYVCREDT